MKKIIRTVLLLTFVALMASVAYPCQCNIMKASKKLRKAKAVFVGEVIEIGSNDRKDGLTVSVKFKVDRYWKGVKEQFVTVIGYSGAAGACGLPVELNEKYLIYAFKYEDQLETSFCVSRNLERATEDLSIIGEGKKFKLKN